MKRTLLIVSLLSITYNGIIDANTKYVNDQQKFIPAFGAKAISSQSHNQPIESIVILNNVKYTLSKINNIKPSNCNPELIADLQQDPLSVYINMKYNFGNLTLDNNFTKIKHLNSVLPDLVLLMPPLFYKNQLNYTFYSESSSIITINKKNYNLARIAYTSIGELDGVNEDFKNNGRITFMFSPTESKDVEYRDCSIGNA